MVTTAWFVRSATLACVAALSLFAACHPSGMKHNADGSAARLPPELDVQAVRGECECGFTIMNGESTCHVCGDKMAPANAQELEYCCNSCGIGSGGGCELKPYHTCEDNGCYVYCACGETLDNGTLTCHNC